jgi:hypothetical protein
VSNYFEELPLIPPSNGPTTATGTLSRPAWSVTKEPRRLWTPDGALNQFLGQLLLGRALEIMSPVSLALR